MANRNNLEHWHKRIVEAKAPSQIRQEKIRRITPEEIEYVKEEIEMHLDWMLKQLEYVSKGERPEGQIRDPRDTVCYEAHAIEDVLTSIKASVQYGKPVQ